MANDKAKIHFYPIDVDYDSQGIIRVLGSTKDGKKVCVYDDSLKPYFWVFGSKNLEKIAKKISEIEVNDNKVIKTEIFEKNYLSKTVKAIKITVNKPSAVKAIAEKVKKFNLEKKEIDINFAKRYLIDKEITPLTLTEVSGEFLDDDNFDYCIKGELKQSNEEFYDKLKFLVVDIEVYGSLGGEEKAKKDPILMIGLLGENLKKVITWKKFKAPKYVEFVKSEAEMIEKFIEEVKNYNPDCIIGYYSDGFDFPYIKARADKYKIKLNLGLDNSVISIRRGLGETTAKIKGILHLDIFKFIRKIMSGSLRLDSYSLDVVANALVHERKKEINVDEITLAWDKTQDLAKFCEYNIHDTELTLKLFKKIYPNLAELVKLLGISMFDICRLSYGQLVENYLVKKAKEFNEIIPNRPTHEKISERIEYTYQGAFVMEPKIGFYKDVVFFDYMSLYPSIIVAKNIDPGTLNNVKKGYKTPEIEEDRKKFVYYFDTKVEGFIPKVVKDLITRRNRIKEILKKEKNTALEARSYALKTVANSSYGMLAFFGARYYCRECAASITAFGREYIQDTIKKAQKEGFQVIYSDTDSLAITLKGKTKKDTLKFLDKINAELPSLMELEIEDFYPRGIFVSKKGDTQGGAKKKYALIDDEGEIKITGFETVRKDWSLIARETQLRVLESILREGNYENALKYVKKIIKDVYDKKISLDKMIIGVQLKLRLEDYKQIGPHVAVAKKMKTKGYDVSPGATIYFIVSSEKGKIRDKAKIPNECKDYDVDYYVENQILPSVEKIFEVFNVSKQELLPKDQSKLGEYG